MGFVVRIVRASSEEAESRKPEVESPRPALPRRRGTGRISFVDTDSCVTDTPLASSSALGDFKDEYPGTRLSVVAYQPKVYTITKKGGVFDGEHLSSCPKSGRCKVDKCKREKATPSPCTLCHGCSSTKTAMKGFPKEQRTEANLARLRRGLVRSAWDGEVAPEDVVAWRRQQKVRTLARAGFKESPVMVDVRKNWRSPYDKRVVMPDGTTRGLVARVEVDPATGEPRTLVRCSSICADPDPATGALALRLCDLDMGHGGLHRGSEVPWEADRLPASPLEWGVGRDACVLFFARMSGLDEEAAD